MHKPMRTMLFLLSLAVLLHAEFVLERADVTISDIKEDGSAKVHESIKFLMIGNYSNALYDSGISKNELSFWTTNTDLKDAKLHVNNAKVDIRDLRVRPQPRTRCNPIDNLCHGELILDYVAYPLYLDADSTELQPDTGIFSITKYKPRTRRYIINPNALAFTTTADGNIILDDDVYLTIELPTGSITYDINPQPTDSSLVLPRAVDSLSWTDIVLVKFSLVFDVEDTIDKEVSDFFGNIARSISRAVRGPDGMALVLLVAVLIGSSFYIIMAKRRGEE